MRNALLLFCFLSPSLLFAQSYSKVKIWLDPVTESILMQEGLEMDHGTIKPGVFMINDLDQATLQRLESQGVRYDVLIEDVKAFYRSRTSKTTNRGERRSSCFDGQEDSVSVPTHFSLGSMAGFYTYEEFLAQLDSMQALYPQLITVRDTIDTFSTHEGRPIYWVKISDNANVNEAEPEVLYTAIHHAREPESLTQLIFYMWYMLENYGTDDEVTMLVDETEMYFVPMLNPDGYIINETNDPNGGGLWRKNARDNGDGTVGVDLNRNYGYEWGYDNTGSSPNTSSQTYRGTSAFSEPETQAIKWFCEQHSFGLAFNYHSYGNYVIYPWGFNDQLTPDSTTFIAITDEMTRYNNYVAGTGIQTVGYAVNGDSDDWMYGAEGILSMTPEVGTQGDGFWPAQSRIVPLSQENVHPNLILAHLVGDYATVVDASPNLLDSLVSDVSAEATRLGLQFNGPYEFSISPISSNIQSVSAPVSFSSMNQSEPVTVDWQLTLDPGTNQGEAVTYEYVAEFNGFEVRVPVTKFYGSPTLLLSNEGDMDDFLTGTNWGITDEDYVSPSKSITDSPYAPHQNNQNNELEYNRIIDLRQADKGVLRFQAKWEIEAGWDYAQILASPVTSNEWTPLCATHSVEGNQYQDEGQPLWDGYQTSWVAEEVDLDDYLGQRIKVKFAMVSDAFVTFDGFYFDDLEVITVLPEGFTDFPDTGYVDTIGTTPPDTSGGVGIQSPKAEAWVMYPNPAMDRVFFDVPSSGEFEVRIMSIAGAEVKKCFVQEQGLDVGDLKKGTYIVELRDLVSDKTQVSRLVLVE